MWCKLLLIFLSQVFVNVSNGFLNENVIHDLSPIVKIKSGLIKGFPIESVNGAIYYAFQGVPYAKPPIGSLRFKPPQPVNPWKEEVFDATRIGSKCPQIVQTSFQMGDEDCLNLNVYTPQVVDTGSFSYPVLVYIHEGGFLMGYGMTLTSRPSRFLDFQVILVTFNYRLGVLGFLSTQDEYAYGNYAMLDQVFALKWVQENIRSFNGDPTRVTIVGAGCGAASVVFHMLSPLSFGLFHRGIALSDTAINLVNKNPRQWAVELAEHLHCPNTKSTKKIVECLRNYDVFRLVEAAREFKITSIFPLHLVPTIEPKGGPGFLTEDPLVLMKEGRIASKVPLIIGMTQHEGYTPYLAMAKHFKYYGHKHYDEEFVELLGEVSHIKPNMVYAIDAILEKYYKGSYFDSLQSFYEVGTRWLQDMLFGSRITLTIDLLSSAGVPVYPYKFNYTGENCTAFFFQLPCEKLCSLGDDLLVIYVSQLPEGKIEDLKMADIIVSLWSAFATNRPLFVNKQETWPKYSKWDPKYLQLTLSPHVKRGLLSYSVEFWFEKIPKLMAQTRDLSEL